MSRTSTTHATAHVRPRSLSSLAAAACSLLVASSTLAADPCSLPRCADESFGAHGRVAIDLGYLGADRGNAVVRVPGEDRLYVVGQVATAIAGDDDFGVACLLPDGSRCPDFGQSGTTTVAMDFTPGGADAAVAAAVLPWGTQRDWRLVVVGPVERPLAGDTDLGVAMLRPDGSLESTVTGSGKVAIPFDLGADLSDAPTTVAVDAEGRIVIGGTVDIAADDTDWGLVRLGPDLSLDTSFGTNGKVVLDVEGLSSLQALTIQPDGRIVAVGSRDVSDAQMLILRLNTDGSPDIGFGLLGRTVFDMPGPGPNDDIAFAVTTDRLGRHVLAGQSNGAVGLCWLAARVLPDGQPDTTFGSGSPTQQGCLSQAVVGARAISILGDGHLIIALESDLDGDHDFVVLDLPPSATTGTLRSYPFDLGGTNDDRPRSMLVQPDGKVVIAGRAVGPSGTLDFGVLRIWSPLVFADGFEAFGSPAEWSLLVTSP
jgi:uncharacterized delta-60 repeat protein